MGTVKITPKEIKQEILGKIKLGEKVSDLARQYGISDRTIYYWLRQNTGDDVVSAVKYNKLKRENEELKRLLGKITLEMSLGKKIELIRRGEIKSVWAEALGISRKNIYRESKLENKDLLIKAEGLAGI
jgi:transposase-like protein